SQAVKIPADWEKFAPLATNPFTVDPAAIAANRATWLADWSATVIG
ncbi:thiamine ABC transporter substrate-binding protein, partial [Cellulomonas rhizosphaerae]